VSGGIEIEIEIELEVSKRAITKFLSLYVEWECQDNKDIKDSIQYKER